MLEKLIKKIPIGSDITIMNTQYQYSEKDEEGNRKPDYIAITYKYNETGKKDHIIIKNPTYKYYRIKEEEYQKILDSRGNSGYGDPNILFIEEDKTIPIEVPYRQLTKSIAEQLGKEAEYNDAIEMRDKDALKELTRDPRIMNSDQSIEDHYRLEFNKYYKNSIVKLHKAFFDIEVDNRYLVSSDFPEPEKAEAPINAISMLDDQYDVVYTFLLRDKNNPLISLFENEYNSGLFTSKDIHDFVCDAMGGWKQMKRNHMENTDYKLLFFDNEIELLLLFFGKVYKFDPDFIEGWNGSAFDLNYIYHRISVLGDDPAKIMSDPNWEFPFCHPFIDQKHINDFAERGDYLRLACNPVWLDQMIQYCSRRKSKMGSFTSFKLDDIARATAGVHKLDYSDITTNLAELPYLDYKRFVLYNIMDTVNQRCIEIHTQDLEYIFAKCVVNNTTYAKGHRQTIYLINRMCKEWNKLPEKYVICNNPNKTNEKPEKFQGALVEDSLTTSGYSKMKLDGVPIFVSNNLIDFD